MAKPNEQVDPAILASTLTTPVPNPAIQDALLRYIQSVIKRNEVQEREEEQERAGLLEKLKKRRIQEAAEAESQERKRLAKEARQANCSHAVKNWLQQDRTVVTGQKTGLSTWTFRCQNCDKHWDDLNKIPPNIRPLPGTIGGPTL